MFFSSLEIQYKTRNHWVNQVCFVWWENCFDPGHMASFNANLSQSSITSTRALSIAGTRAQSIASSIAQSIASNKRLTKAKEAIWWTQKEQQGSALGIASTIASTIAKVYSPITRNKIVQFQTLKMCPTFVVAIAAVSARVGPYGHFQVLKQTEAAFWKHTLYRKSLLCYPFNPISQSPY